MPEMISSGQKSKICLGGMPPDPLAGTLCAVYLRNPRALQGMKTVPVHENCGNAHDSLVIVLRIQTDEPTPISGKSEQISKLCCFACNLTYSTYSNHKFYYSGKFC